MPAFLVLVGLVWLVPAVAGAADVGISARKLVVKDYLAATGKARVKFLARSHPGITKGGGTDPTMIAAELEVSYVDGSVSGSFLMPSGAGWIVNNTRVAQYVNAGAPAGGSVKVGIVRSVKRLQLYARSLGDDPIDILTPGAPGPGGVRTVYTVDNGGEITRHCTIFTGCAYKVIERNGSNAKLTCRDGTPAACP
jgi:hypothetical protein